MPTNISGRAGLPHGVGAIVQSSAFKLAAMLAVLFACSSLLLFAFVYWQTIRGETQRIKQELTREILVLPKTDDAHLAKIIADRINSPAHRLNYAGLFTPSGQALMGNIPALPVVLHRKRNVPIVNSTSQSQTDVDGEQIIMVGLVLPDTRILVIGRSADSVDTLDTVLVEALERGIIPATFLALLMGVVASLQSHARIRGVTQSMERIMQGNLQERLPVRNGGVEIDRLSVSVNSMLDEIALVLEEAQSTGKIIAHDLRTPLTRVRTRLERACRTAQSHAELMGMVEQGISSLDQALTIITALLRLGQIESRQIHASFDSLDLGLIVQEIGEMYQPLAEEKDIAMTVSLTAAPAVLGDKDLLNEAIINLVDNAVKFTPEGGNIRLEVQEENGSPVVAIYDTGPGIDADEVNLVWNRFYRSQRNRQVSGYGLGLSIVSAIIQLHNFSIGIIPLSQGTCFKIVCAPHAAVGPSPIPV